MTDGEDHDSLPLEAARNASEAGVPIFVVAIGNLLGAKIPILDASGHRSYKTFDGEPVVSKPDVETLREIARISGGRYYYADSRFNFAQIYKDSVDLLARSKNSEHDSVQFRDLYQPFLVVGLIAFLSYYLIPLRFPSKRRQKDVLIPLLFVFEIFSQACLAGDSNGFKVDASTFSGKTRDTLEQIQDYNRAIKQLEQDANEETISLLTQLADSQNLKVASRSNFNLGVERIKQAQRMAEPLLSTTPRRLKNEQNGDVGKDKAPSHSEIVARYNEERAKRNALRQETLRIAQDSSVRFSRAFPNAKLEKRSKDNVEIVANWAQSLRKSGQEYELERRSQLFNSPKIRLLWLQTELDDYIKRLDEIDFKSLTPSSFQSMYEGSNSLAILERDAEIIVDGVKNLPLNFKSSHSGGTSASNTIDSDEEAKIDSAKNEFIKLNKEAASLLSQYNAKTSRGVMKKARNQLRIIDEVSTSYPELVARVAREEEQCVRDKNTEELSRYGEISIESYYWNRNAFRNSVDEFERKAREIVSSSHLNEVSNPCSKESSEEPSLSSDEIPNSRATSEQSFPFDGISEVKILESAQAALKYDSELHNLVTQIQQLLGNDSEQKVALDSRQSQTLVSKQERISQIMQEIVRPFREEQPNDQEQQNQNNERNSQDKNQQEQNQSDGKTQDNQDESSSSQSQPNDDSEKNQDENRNLQPHQNKKEQRQRDVKKTESENEKNLTPEQKEAKALIRQVERRQKDAEEQRHFIQQALRKREKTGKDW